MSDDKLTLKGERIAKVIARAGVCSRREAERKIEAGVVSVDGKVIDSPALNVHPSNIIVVDGKALPDRQPARLWKFHKPRGVITSNNDPEGRQTVFDLLPKWAPRLITVGRLDYNTEGLLLMTNDGELARFLEKPDSAMVRRYRVRVHGRVNEEELEALKEGPVIEGIQYGPVEAILDIQKGANAWINISIKEGKNREVRKIMESLGYDVSRLIRTDYGPVQLGKQLPTGELEEIPRKAISEWFGGKVPGIAAPNTGTREGFAKAKESDKPWSKGPRRGKKIEEKKSRETKRSKDFKASKSKGPNKGKKSNADRRR